MGSSNFTSGGFGNNTELNICVEGKRSDPFFRQVSTFIDEQKKRSYPINTEVFDEYQSRYKAFRNARRKLEKFNGSKKAVTWLNPCNPS